MFPIIDHIFKMNKVAYILIVCLIICIIKTCVYFSTLPSNFQLDADEEMVDTPQLFTNLAIVASLLTLFLMNQLFHCFTFLMAVERFTIYFFPSSEKIVLKFQTYVTKHIKFAYCLLIVKDILALIYALWKHVNLKGGIDVYFIYFVSLIIYILTYNMNFCNGSGILLHHLFFASSRQFSIHSNNDKYTKACSLALFSRK